MDPKRDFNSAYFFSSSNESLENTGLDLLQIHKTPYEPIRKDPVQAGTKSKLPIQNRRFFSRSEPPVLRRLSGEVPDSHNKLSCPTC